MFVYVKWNRFRRGLLADVYVTKACLGFAGHSRNGGCDAGGGAFRPQWKEWPAFSTFSSAGSQCSHRVNARGSSCRNVPGKQCYCT